MVRAISVRHASKRGRDGLARSEDLLDGTDPQIAVALASSETRLVPLPEAEAQIPTLVAGNTAFALDLYAAARGTKRSGRDRDPDGRGGRRLSWVSTFIILAVDHNAEEADFALLNTA